MKINEHFELQAQEDEISQMFALCIAKVWSIIPPDYQRRILRYYGEQGAGLPHIHLRNNWDSQTMNQTQQGDVVLGQVIDPQFGAAYDGRFEINFNLAVVTAAYSDQRIDVLESLVAHEFAHAYQCSSGWYAEKKKDPVLQEMEPLDRKKRIVFLAERDAERLEDEWVRADRKKWKEGRFGNTDNSAMWSQSPETANFQNQVQFEDE